MIADMEAVFAAVADPTRRFLLERLRSGGPASITTLGDGLPMSRQAVTKHLDMLRAAGLVRVRRDGRERLHELDSAPLHEVDDWLRPYAGPGADAGAATLVAWALEPLANGGTRLHLRESGLSNGRNLEMNPAGWFVELAELREHLATEPWQVPIRRRLELRADRDRVWRA